MTGPLADARAIARFLDEAVDLGTEPLVEERHEALARGWEAAGVRRGDLVLLTLPTGVALLRQFFGVLGAGGVPALVAPGTPSARLAEMAQAMGARAIAGLAPTPSLRSLPGVVRFARVGLVEAALLDGVPPMGRAGEVVLLTSGTSGAASGCVTTVEALGRNALRHAASLGQREGEPVLVCLPLHFSFALVAQAVATLLARGRLLVAAPPFSPDRYVHALAAHRVALSALSPTQVRALLRSPSGAAFPPSLRALSVGGDALAPEHVAELLARRPGGELFLTYGLTQAGPRVSTLAAHREPATRHASVGLPIDGTRVELEPLLDGSGRQQLIVHSDTVALRRIGLVEGRQGDELRAPGVLATGDLFSQDADGYLFYRGRTSEYIVRGGEKVSVAAVRRLATRLPGVLTARARVVAAADGEDFDLQLVFAEGEAPPVESALRAALARLVRRSELPRTIEVVGPDAPGLGYK